MAGERERGRRGEIFAFQLSGDINVGQKEGGGERCSLQLGGDIRTDRLGGGVEELDCVCYWCSCLRASFSDVLAPTPLPLPLQVLSTISGCTMDQGISIYELMKKVGQHGFGEKNIK